MWVPVAAGLLYFSTRKDKAGIPLLALILSMIGLWAFTLPPGTGAVALYGAFVLMLVGAAFTSGSRDYEIAALVLASLYAVYNLTWYFTGYDISAAARTVSIINGLAGAYFLWKGLLSKTKKKKFHLVLAVMQFSTIAMRYFHLLAGAIPGASEIASNFWFVLTMNRLFDIQILLLLTVSRLRVHAMKNLNAWALWQEEFFELYAKIKSVLGLGPKPKRD